MADASRINLYGVFARFKDSIARNMANSAKNTADTANNTADNALASANQAKIAVNSALIKAEEATTTANSSKNTANNALTSANAVSLEYQEFKKRNSYLKSLNTEETNIDIGTNSSHKIIFPEGINKNTIIPETSRLFISYEISIVSGNMSSVASDITLYIQINGSTSKRMSYFINNRNESIANWNVIFSITNIDSISQITTSIRTSKALSGITIRASVTAIPISAELPAEQ